MAEMSKTTLEPGCYFDAAFGFDFNAHRILEFALSLGFEAEDEDLEEFATLQNPAMCGPANMDIIVFVLDDIEEYLNENARAEELEDTHYWGFQDGDFGLWAIEEEDL